MIMASHLITYLVLFYVVTTCSCYNANLLNVSDAGGWAAAAATWYGAPNGAGSDGGACGYGNTVSQPPFNSFISAGGPSLYLSGKGCGACYEVKCSSNAACSGNPVMVVITDSCPGCRNAPIHFDLSGTAFGGMAASGKADQLRNAGKLPIQYRRVGCQYRATTLAFHVDSGSNNFHFATVIEYEPGDGEIAAVALKQANSAVWAPMTRDWGAVWKLDNGAGLTAPFSIKLTGDSGKAYFANNAIPAGWKPGQTYRAPVSIAT